MSSDWKSLSQINFLIYRRMSEQLDTALSALEQIPQSQDQERALHAASNARDLYSAWANLIRYKAGETPAITGPQQISACFLLRWIATTLHMSKIPDCDEKEVLKGNLETIQEALIALRSCAQSLGPRAHVVVQRHQLGFWIRVRYGSSASSPSTLDDLMASMQSNWRQQTAAFELASAIDFLRMNEVDVFYSLQDGQCEIAFLLPFVNPPSHHPSSRERVKTLLDSYNELGDLRGHHRSWRLMIRRFLTARTAFTLSTLITLIALIRLNPLKKLKIDPMLKALPIDSILPTLPILRML